MRKEWGRSMNVRMNELGEMYDQIEVKRRK